MIQSLEGMDLADRLREMSGRIKQRIDNVKTEEATKNALVMPFINHVVGCNVFDPAEVVPEFIADVGTKKGEKVDYAIFQDGDPIMLFECKHYGVDLGKVPASQGVAGLLRRHSDLEPRGRPEADQYPGRKEPMRDPARQHEPTAHLSAVLQQGAEENRAVERAQGRRAGGDRFDQRHLRTCGPNQGHGPAVRSCPGPDAGQLAGQSRHKPPQASTNAPGKDARTPKRQSVSASVSCGVASTSISSPRCRSSKKRRNGSKPRTARSQCATSA